MSEMSAEAMYGTSSEPGVTNIDSYTIAVTPPAPKAKYTIFTYGQDFQARDEKTFTEDEVNAYVKTVLIEGYTTYPEPNRFIIYPGHTIKKVDVVRA